MQMQNANARFARTKTPHTNAPSKFLAMCSGGFLRALPNLKNGARRVFRLAFLRHFLHTSMPFRIRLKATRAILCALSFALFGLPQRANEPPAQLKYKRGLRLGSLGRGARPRIAF